MPTIVISDESRRKLEAIRTLLEDHGYAPSAIFEIDDHPDSPDATDASTSAAPTLDLILDTTLDGYILADQAGNILQVNRSYSDLMGYTQTELVGKNVAELEASLSPDEVGKKIRGMLQHGRAQFETQHRSSTGEAVDIDVRISVTDGPEGPLFVAFLRDITTQKRAARAIQQNLSWSESLFENAAIPIWEEDFSEVKKALDEVREKGVQDFDRYFRRRPEEVQRFASLVRVRDVNQKSLELYQASSKEDLNQFLPDWFTQESLEAFREELLALAAGADRWEGEVPVRTPTGEDKKLQVFLSILPHHREPWDRVFVSFIDITDQVRFEKALMERERQLSTLFKNLPGVAYRCANDSELTMELVSDGCQALTGYESDALVGNRLISWADLIHPEDRDGVWIQVQEAVSKDRPFELTYRITTATGEERWVWEQGEAVTSPGEVGRHLEGYIVDITSRVGAENATREAREQLRSLSNRLVQIRETERTSISRELHDELGQALTSLQIDLRLVRAGMTSEPREILEIVEGMAVRLEDTVEAVQDLSARLRPPILDVLGIEAALEWQAGEVAKRTDLRFEFDLPEQPLDLPPELATAAFRIAQEALTNVVRHAHAQRVQMSLKALGDGVELRVRDDGVGISEDALEGPLSLGLVGMRERATALGGSISVQRGLDVGTEVVFSVETASGMD